MPDDGFDVVGGFQQNRQFDAVAIGKAGFVAADYTHAGAMFDGMRAFLDDTALQGPGFEMAGLKVNIGRIDGYAVQCRHDPVYIPG